MSDLLRLVVVFIAVVSPSRLVQAAPLAGRRQARMRTYAGGLAAAAAVGVVLAAVSGPMLDFFDLSAPTFRIGAGIVLIAAGLRAVLIRQRPWEDLEPGWKTALVPIGFPVLLTPELVAAAVSFGTDDGVGATTAGVLAGLAVAGVVAALRRDGADRRLDAAVTRFAGMVTVVVGVGLTIAGILDV